MVDDQIIGTFLEILLNKTKKEKWKPLERSDYQLRCYLHLIVFNDKAGQTNRDSN